jgi:hypothetical protein
MMVTSPCVQLAVAVTPNLKAQSNEGKPGSSEVPWWNNEWDFRWPINITGQDWKGSNYIEDYQVQVVLNPLTFDFSEARNDGGDLRFVYWNATDKTQNELSYWIQTWNPLQLYAKVWVKVPYIFANETEIIWMYYGNPSAIGKSSFAETMQGLQPINGSALLLDFGNIQGNIISDSSGRNNTGIIHNAEPLEDFLGGKSLFFNGEDSWVEVANASLPRLAYVTVEAWINPSPYSDSKDRVLVYVPCLAVAAPSFILYLGPSGEIVWQVMLSNESFVILQAPTIPSNTWSFIAAEFDGSSLKIFLNGELVASVSVEGTLIQSQNNFNIGYYWARNPIWFDGQMSELRVLNDSLTEEQIKADFEWRKYVYPEPSVTIKLLSEKWVQLLQPTAGIVSGSVETKVNITVSAYYIDDVVIKISNSSKVLVQKYMYPVSPNFWQAVLETTTIPDGNYSFSVDVTFASGYTISSDLGLISVSQNVPDRIVTFLSENSIIVIILFLLLILLPWTLTLKTETPKDKGQQQTKTQNRFIIIGRRALEHEIHGTQI